MGKFCIIIPFFNSESTLENSVISIISQHFTDWELILVNDGSTDYSLQVTNHFIVLPNIRIINQINLGVAVSRNRGAEKSKGEWLIFLDADDQLKPYALKSFYDFICQNPKIQLIRGGFDRVTADQKATYIPNQVVPQSFLSGSFAIEASLFREMGGYDERLRFSENAEFAHRLQLRGVEVGFLEKSILIYNESHSGGSKNLQNMIDSLTIILEKHSETLSTHVKHLYHQIIGVNEMRFRNFSSARFHLLKAIEYKPLKVATWGRFALACFPFLAKQLYSETVMHD